jgi:hypothetical protein
MVTLTSRYRRILLVFGKRLKKARCVLGKRPRSNLRLAAT